MARAAKLPLPFEELMRRHDREILRYLIRVTGNREDGADLFQETWLRAYRAYPRIDACADLRPWLYAIAANLCRNHRRNGARRSRVIAADNGTSSQNPPERRTMANHGGEGFAAIHIRELIGKLPAKQRDALTLRCFGGLEYAEIAKAMDCSPESARANYSNAVRRLKALW